MRIEKPQNYLHKYSWYSSYSIMASLYQNLVAIVNFQSMANGVTGETGLIAPKSVAQEQRIEQDPAQTQLLNTAEQTALEKKKNQKNVSSSNVLVSSLTE